MKDNEKEFLAQVAIGWFVVNLETGEIWRAARSIGGSRTGTKPYMKMLERPIRAEKCVSNKHLKICFTVGCRNRMGVYAHRAVWMIANRAEIPEGMEINHKDGNPRNNKPSNLEIVTHQENVAHAGRVLGVMGKKYQMGEDNASARLTEGQVRTIRRLCAEKQVPQRKIAEMFGVNQGTVSAIHVRKSWAHIPD